MKYSDIKEKYVYYVDFNPVRACEFNNNHLAVVLKKNNDKKTAIVMPLTSRENGVGTNKMLLPTINDLPARLKGDDSYAVYDQVRSVNYNRFQPVFENTTGMVVVDVKLDDAVFLSQCHQAMLLAFVNGYAAVNAGLKTDYCSHFPHVAHP